MRNLKRLLSMCLALALVVTIAGVSYFVKDASADSYDQAKVSLFTDIDGHWAKNSLANLIGYGYMHGIGNNKADPTGKLTTAQLVTLLVRIMGGAEEADLSSYVDVDKGAWYYTYFAQGVNMGIVPNTNSNYLNPGQESSREYAAYMLCRAFGLTTREPIDDYTDADKVSSWAVTSMQAMVAAKAITGGNGQNNSRTLNPQETITRAEFAEMVYRLCKNFVQASDSATIRGGTIDGGILIAKSGARMNGVTVKGNVYISDAVGTGDVTLADTKVEGNIYVRGSGERSVHLEGTTTANSVVFLNPYNATRLVVEDDAKINGVLINNGVDEVTLEGNVGNVTINVSDVDLTFEKAVATNVIVNSANSTVTVDKDSHVEALTVASSSSGVGVVNKGEITRLALMANNAKLDLEGVVDYLLIGAVSGLDLKMSKDIKLTGLDLHCSNSTISVDSEVGTISVSGFSEKLKLEVGKNAKVTAIGISSSSTDLAVAPEATVGVVTLDAPKYKGTVSSDLKTLTIGAGATEAELTLAKDTDIDVLNIYASKVKLIANSGATVKDINVTGTEVSITGQGAVERVNIAETANKASVETPNTKVSNAGAADVKAGTVDLPANKSYTTTSSGKDVVRNNDGTPDGDGDKNTGAAQEVATVANYTLTFAANATPQDLDPSAKWKLDDLGNGISLTKNSGTGSTYKLSGNVKKVENFLPVFDPIAGYGTGYYVPVVLEAESMATETMYTAEVNGVRYSNANVSKGAGYQGKLIVFLQLQPGTLNKTTTVTFDRDGTETKYSPVTVSIDYTDVTFDGAQDLTGQLFSYPTNATKADLTKDGKFELADFGQLSLSGNAGTSAYNVLGTATYIETAPNGNVGSVAEGTTVHHYVPLMINTSAFQNGWTVVLDGTNRYTNANVSGGTGCRGHLILLLPLTANNGMTHTIYLDSDGDGRVDLGGTYTFNCVGVTLAARGQGTSGGNPEKFSKVSVVVPSNGGEIIVADPDGYFKDFTGDGLKKELYDVVTKVLSDNFTVKSSPAFDAAKTSVEFKVTAKGSDKELTMLLHYGTCLSTSSAAYLTEFVTVPEYINVAYSRDTRTCAITDISQEGTFANMENVTEMVQLGARYLASRMHADGFGRITIQADEDKAGTYWVYGSFADTEYGICIDEDSIVHDYKEPEPEFATVTVSVPGEDETLKRIDFNFPKADIGKVSLQDIIDGISDEYRVVWGTHYYASSPLFANFKSTSEAATLKVADGDIYFFGYIAVDLTGDETECDGVKVTASFGDDAFEGSTIFANDEGTLAYMRLGDVGSFTVSVSAGTVRDISRFMFVVNGANIRGPESYTSLEDAPKTNPGVVSLGTEGTTVTLLTAWDVDNEEPVEVSAFTFEVRFMPTGEFSYRLSSEEATLPTVE